MGFFICCKYTKNFFQKKFFISESFCTFAENFKTMKTVDTVKQVEFDVFKTLHVIENDKALDSVFRDGNTQLSYAMLRTMAKQKTLKADTLATLEKIFERLILKNPTVLRKYEKLSISDKPEKKLPKHYGKQRILADIESNDTKTELDRAMLALNDLRNVYSRIKNRGIKDKTLGTKILTRDDCRNIIATVRIVENRLADILKKK